MNKLDLEEMTDAAISRAETYLHHAKVMVLREFGPAAEHNHAEVVVALAAAMMQHEGAQVISKVIDQCLNDGARSEGGRG